MNKLSQAKRAIVVRCLVDGNSLRATTRITGVHRTTCMNLLARLGEACAEYQDTHLRNLPCKRIECDEIWSFVYAKEKNATDKAKQVWGAGDVWTWAAICTDTKLVPCWFVGPRDAVAAYHFMHDLKSRLANRVQLSTDGFKPYLSAVENAFGAEIDYAQLIKLYGKPEGQSPERRYSPVVCTGARKKLITGEPDGSKVSTSIVERQNLTMRMSMRRFTRLTNAFSKKLENHEHAIALHFMNYNFCRIHKTLRCTPAMEAGVTDRVWEIHDLIGLLKD